MFRITSCSVNLKLHPGDFMAHLSTHAGEGTWLGPVKVSVNCSSGEVPAAETRTNGFGPIKLPWNSCSGNVSSDPKLWHWSQFCFDTVSCKIYESCTSKHVVAPQECFRLHWCGKGCWQWEQLASITMRINPNFPRWKLLLQHESSAAMTESETSQHVTLSF